MSRPETGFLQNRVAKLRMIASRPQEARLARDSNR
jgi:hypothetical protein